MIVSFSKHFNITPSSKISNIQQIKSHIMPKGCPCVSQFMRTPERLYLSLGDREEHTKNPVMRTVGERTRRLKELYEHEGISCIYEENPGNHFREPELRTARAIAWLLQ